MALAIHPRTQKLEEVEMIDNGPSRDFTVRFPNGDEFPEYGVVVYGPSQREEEQKQ
jgi:hypothetical protein